MAMSIDQQTLATRLKEARSTSQLTQEQVAQSLALPRTAIVQIEAGNRSVSTLELAKLSELFGRPIASFFNDSTSAGEEDVLVALFRAAGQKGDPQPWQSEVSRCLAICRVGVELEGLLDRPAHAGPPSYDLQPPRRAMEAVDQGCYVAEQERRRLGLELNPIHDIADLINSQNVWASGAHLPDGMSGLYLKHSSVGLCILVNFDHPRARKRFSYAHEYAHALLDRRHTATVSLEGNRSDLGEVRANAFAAALLLPRSGVWAFLQGRFKAGPSVIHSTIYDPATEENAKQVRVQRRAAPRSQALSYEDVAALAHHFGVSYQAALFRLKSLSIVNGEEFSELREKEQSGKAFLQMLQLLDDLDGRDERAPDREIVSQVLHLALEAYRREEISKGKLRDLSSLLGVPAKTLLNLADDI
jgi:Zn-dependent peptidase ImmA (M78 family)/transcriptional regulator with XRE-family HTH domain